MEKVLEAIGEYGIKLLIRRRGAIYFRVEAGFAERMVLSSLNLGAYRVEVDGKEWDAIILEFGGVLRRVWVSEAMEN